MLCCGMLCCARLVAHPAAAFLPLLLPCLAVCRQPPATSLGQQQQQDPHANASELVIEWPLPFCRPQRWEASESACASRTTANFTL